MSPAPLVRTEILRELIGQLVDADAESPPDIAPGNIEVEVEVERRQPVAQATELAQLSRLRKVPMPSPSPDAPRRPSAAVICTSLRSAIPRDGRLDRAARRRLLNEAAELPHAAHLLAVELDDHVRLLQAGFLGRAVGQHVLDDDTASRVGLSGRRFSAAPARRAGERRCDEPVP